MAAYGAGGVVRIGIDARPLREKQTSGIPMFVRSLLDSLAAIDKKNEYFLYVHKDFECKLPGPNFSKRPGRYARYGTLWMQTELPFALLRDKIDIFWGTQHTLPVHLSRDIKAVLTVHDLVHFVFPKTMKPMNLLVNKFLIPPSVHRADAIAADTEWTLSDVERYLRPRRKSLNVVYLGINRAFSPRDAIKARDRVAQQFGLPTKFLLTVGTFEPRKNIAGLFKAFALIANKIPHHLAVVGQRGWKNEMVRDEMRRASIHNRIHLLGYVPDEALPDIYSAADVFVFPSVYEGFGLPPLEAMACGVPVVSSNVSSIPEIVGDAAFLVNPHDPLSISEGILKVLGDENLRNQHVALGLKRAAFFTWEKTARQMLSIFGSLK